MDELQLLLNGAGGDFSRSNFEESFNLATGTGSKAVQVIGKLPQHEQAVIMNAMRQASSGNNNGITRKIGDAPSTDEIHSLISNSVGDLNLTVTRVGINVLAPLPFILFGANDSTANYVSTLNGLLNNLPVGTTLVVTTSTAGDIVFTYTLNGNSDTVTISNLGNVNYKSFLTAMNNNYFATKYLLLSISDETYNQAQFGQPLLFGNLSALGLTKANQLVLRSRTNSWMFRKDRIEVVFPEQNITPDFSFAMSIIAVTGFSIGFDFFMSKRLNLNKSV